MVCTIDTSPACLTPGATATSKDVWLGCLLSRIGSASVRISLRPGVIRPVVIGENKRIILGQHREDYVFADSAALQLNQSIRIQIEAVWTIANDRYDSLLPKACTHQFDYCCVCKRSFGRLLRLRGYRCRAANDCD
jgi:hypothetical protein